MDNLFPVWSEGAAAVGNGGQSVTISGTNRLTSAGIRPGDQFKAQGVMATITAAPTSNNELAIKPWQGSNLSAATGNYEIIRLGDTNAIISAWMWMQEYLVPNLMALGELQGAANKLPFFSGTNTLALADMTPAARAIIALAGSSGAKVPVVTGAGTAALRDIVGVASQSGGVPTGALMEAGNNANGRYWRFAGGLQICARALAGTSGTFAEIEVVWPAAFATLYWVDGTENATGVGNTGGSGQYLSLRSPSAKLPRSSVTSTLVSLQSAYLTRLTNTPFDFSFIGIGAWH